jgi:mRNA interferase RelE/StbE
LSITDLNDWQYRILKPAERYLKRIQPKSRQRIFDELDKLIIDPTQVNFKKLKGRDGYRLRVGDYRVLIQVQREERLFIVTNIGSRGDVYK